MSHSFLCLSPTIVIKSIEIKKKQNRIYQKSYLVQIKNGMLIYQKMIILKKLPFYKRKSFNKPLSKKLGICCNSYLFDITNQTCPQAQNIIKALTDSVFFGEHNFCDLNFTFFANYISFFWQQLIKISKQPSKGFKVNDRIASLSQISQLVVISWKINHLLKNRLCQYRIQNSVSMQTTHSIKDIKIGLVSRQKPLTKEKGVVKAQPGIANFQNRNGSTESMGYLPLRRKPTLKTQSSSANHNTMNIINKQVVDLINLSNPFVKLGGNIQSVTERKNYCFHQMEDSSASCLPSKPIINSKSSQAPPTVFTVCSTKENQRERERETSPFGRQPNVQAHFPIIQQVLEVVKTKHLPNLINRLMKDIYDDFSHLRMEFKSLKDGVDSQLQRQEWIVNEIKNNQVEVANNNNTINRFQLILNQSNLSKTADITNLKSQLSKLNFKYEEIQMKLNENLNKIEKQMHQIGLQIEQFHLQPKVKRSLLRSSMSPLLIQYKQSFAIKKSTLSSFSGNDSPSQIAINSYEFLIDSSGFLMDSQGYYLVDRNGQQLQLDEKHIKQLQEHGILKKNQTQ